MALFSYRQHDDLTKLLEKYRAQRSLRQTIRSIAIGVAAGGVVYAILLLRAMALGY